MAGAGALAGTAPAVFSASLNTNGSMTGTASFTFAASASITGIGAMVGSSPIAFSQTGNITGLLAAAGTSALLFGQTGTLSATAAMQATGTTVFGQTGNLVGISNTPTIIAVSSAFPKWQSTLTITVLNMSTAQGKVYIGGLLQAITLWNPAGTIQITVGRGTLQYGVNYDLIVKNDDGTPSPPWTVQLTPQTGWQYTVLTNPLAGVSGRLTGQPMDLAPGYIVAYGLALGTGSVTVRPDASFIVASTVVAFDAEAHNGIGWGAIGRETFV
jgi:hypothetical protein